MAIWDDIYNGIAGIYTFITVSLAVMLQTAIDGITGIVGGIANLITDTLGAIADIITYPIISILTHLGDIVGHVITPLIGLVVNVQNTGTAMTDIVTELMAGMFDLAWISIIGVGVGFIVLIRVYHFVKDIEILGFKV